MDHLHEYCARMMGDREAATWTVREVRRVYGQAPLHQLTQVVQACRTAEEEYGAPPEPEPVTPQPQPDQQQQQQQPVPPPQPQPPQP